MLSALGLPWYAKTPKPSVLSIIETFQSHWRGHYRDHIVPCMVRDSIAFGSCFYISYVFLSTGVKRPACFADITPGTIGIRNFVNNTNLRSRELLLWGVHWLRDWSKSITGWGGGGAFENVVNKKHMAHPLLLVQSLLTHPLMKVENYMTHP